MVPMSLVSHISDIMALGTPCDCHICHTKFCSSVPGYKKIVVEACNLIYSGNYVINSEHINSEPVENLLAKQSLVPGWVCCSSYVWLSVTAVLKSNRSGLSTGCDTITA